jgi:hypothetical protein
MLIHFAHTKSIPVLRTSMHIRFLHFLQLIQDLSDIATFCRLNDGELKNTNFDFNLADKARSAVEELTDELADNDLRKIQPSEVLEKRNRLCNELYETMVEICATGKKTFKKDPQRKKAYRVY